MQSKINVRNALLGIITLTVFSTESDHYSLYLFYEATKSSYVQHNPLKKDVT